MKVSRCYCKFVELYSAKLLLYAMKAAAHSGHPTPSRRELTLALEKEKELNEMKARFVTMALHEFRTPISTILSSAYLIEKYATTEEQPRRVVHLHRIISSVNLLNDILNDFLSAGKIEEGKIQARLSKLSIAAQLSSIIERMEGILRKGQSIRYIHKGGDEILLDSSLLQHIVSNLLSNAIKFSPENSVIEIRTVHSEKYFTLSVKDKGIGIAAEDQKHLGERFFRGANVINIQGTGLGLHIVKKYAELMHGSVQCISALEKGTTFTVKFRKETA